MARSTEHRALRDASARRLAQRAPVDPARVLALPLNRTTANVGRTLVCPAALGQTKVRPTCSNVICFDLDSARFAVNGVQRFSHACLISRQPNQKSALLLPPLLNF